MLHLFSMQESINDDRETAVSDFFQTLINTKLMFDVCSQHPDFDLLGTEHEGCESDALELPLLPNIYGLTSLDYCLPGSVPEHHIDFTIFNKNDKAF